MYISVNETTIPMSIKRYVCVLLHALAPTEFCSHLNSVPLKFHFISKTHASRGPGAVSQAPDIAPAICKAPAMGAQAPVMEAPAHAMHADISTRHGQKPLAFVVAFAAYLPCHLPPKSTCQLVSVCSSFCSSARGSVDDFDMMAPPRVV